MMIPSVVHMVAVTLEVAVVVGLVEEEFSAEGHHITVLDQQISLWYDPWRFNISLVSLHVIDLDNEAYDVRESQSDVGVSVGGVVRKPLLLRACPQRSAHAL